MNRKRTIIILLISAVILALLLRPVRLYFRAFFTTLFAKEIIVYDKIPVSNDPVYNLVHTGKFESDKYVIVRTDSVQMIRDKITGKKWEYRIKWIYANEYFLYDSTGRILGKNKIKNLTDTSYTSIYNSGGVGIKAEFKIKTIPEFTK